MPRRQTYIHYPGGVRVSKDPDARGMYRIRFTKPDGRDGDARRSSWHEADAFARELSGFLNRTDNGTVGETVDGATIADAVELFLDPDAHRETPATSYMLTAASHARTHIVPAVGDVPCQQWDRDVSQQVIDHCVEAGLAPSTVSTVVGTLSSIAKLAERHGMLPRGAAPVRGVYHKKGKALDLTELPTGRDVEKVANALTELGGDDVYALLAYVAAYSGLRAGESLGLHVGDVDLGEGTIRVARQYGVRAGEIIPPKSGSERVTVFPAFLDELWERAVAGRDPDRPVWTSRDGGYLPYTTFRHLWRRAREAAGWPRTEHGFKWRYHDLRHYFCTWALAADGLGLDVADVSRFAGHANPQITWQVYVQSRPDRVNRAREASRKAAR